MNKYDDGYYQFIAEELKKDYEKNDWHPALTASEMICYLKKQNDELKDFAIWMTGCGYDFTQHQYFIKCRDKLLINND